MRGEVIVRGVLAAAMVVLATNGAMADVFNMPSGLTSLDMVSVGNPGNAGELSVYGAGDYIPGRICGAVDYNYQIGKYEVTAGQYTEFLNHKATVTDPYWLYDGRMTLLDNSFFGCNIQCTGSEGSYSYSVASDWANRPVNWVGFWDAARFCNWLHNGQGDGDTETGAYTLNGYNDDDGRSITRNPGAKYFIPSEDEWYKAAYHKNDGATGNYWDFSTGSDTLPSNVLGVPTDPGNNATWDFTIGPEYYRTEVGEHENSDSPYGTFDQGGNVWEWNEAVVFIEGETKPFRGARGGSFAAYFGEHLHATCRIAIPTMYYQNFPYTGFRVASVPEPGSMAMLAGIALTALLYWRVCNR